MTHALGNLAMADLAVAASIAAGALAVNVPLGYLREGARKYSAAWFLWVHLSVPAIAFFRVRGRITLWAIPVFAACAVAGQLVGGRLRRRREGRSA